jgi:triacylglycerol lipase
MIPYDASRESLFQPGRATNFFQEGPLTSDAALCAEMARLAYVESEADLRTFLARASFSLVTAADVAGSQAFVAARDGDAVVAFRGTQSDDPTDLGSDADIELVDLDDGGRVHRGFARALDAVWPAVAPAIPAGARVLVTGHSLGAALATLAALRRRGAILFTFGSPRVGDTVFAGRADHPPHERWVDCADIVTRIPPSAPGYAHTGTLHYIDRAGRHRAGIGDTEIDADRRHAETEYLTKHAFRKGTVAVRDLADHTPINYVSGVAGLRGEG